MSRDLPLKERRAIDYVEDPKGPAFGVVEAIDFDNAIFGGALSASEIAQEFGVSTRAVQRRRAALRARGYRVPVVEFEMTDAHRVAVGRASRARAC